MGDYISRQAAIDAIWDGTNYDIYTREVKEILEHLPSVQPVQRTGEWILLGCGWARCSQCGVKHINVYDDDHWYNFCPHCGTKMEGVKLSVPLSIFTRTVKQK